MLTASQDIDYFIERQRSKLNKGTNRQQANRTRPAAPLLPLPPPPRSVTPISLEDRLDVKAARILNEPSPRAKSRQSYVPPSPRQLLSSPFPEQTTFPLVSERDQQNISNDNDQTTTFGFFNRFGNHEEVRAQLKDDLKREYNEYLRSQPAVKNRSNSKKGSPTGPSTRRVRFQQGGNVVAPWEKGDKRTTTTTLNTTDISSSVISSEYVTNRSRSRLSEVHDEQYIRDREEYILELYDQIRELEARKRQLELESSRLTTNNSSSVTRSHYAEDLNALNTLLAERLNQRNAMDHELARILNRPPVSTTASQVISSSPPALNMSFEQPSESTTYRSQPNNDNRNRSQRRYDNRSTQNNDNGFRIGQEFDKDVDNAAKKRYQQELQAQIREKQMRKVQEKQEKNEYERKLEGETNRYNYFGRSGGGAPMRDRDGNVVANLADLRNPQQHQSPRTQQPYIGANDKIYSLGGGASSIMNAPFYNGDPQQNVPSSVRIGTPNHARGAVHNGIFGSNKTEEQIMREEKYKQDLKQQIEEKRQRNAEDLARRRAEEERELAKHIEWQQQMEKRTAEETLRKQEKEVQERQHQQRLQEELDRQRMREETMTRRKPKREEARSPRNDDDESNRQDTYDAPLDEPYYRSSSPPVPTLKNKDKKKPPKTDFDRRKSTDDPNDQSLQGAADDNDELLPGVTDDNHDSRQSPTRKPVTPKSSDAPPARKKPPQKNRSRPPPSYNNGGVFRTNSTTSLRSDGSDSEVLTRLEHLKQQLKDKEARLHQHAKFEAATLPNIEETLSTTYQPPSKLPSTRNPYRNVPPGSDHLLRFSHADDDDELRPTYFRDDSILMRGGGGAGASNGGYISPSKRVDFADGIFVTNLDDAVRRRRYGFDPPRFYDHNDPTSMASLELNRIAEQNEHRLKKLRDLEKDDTSLLDNNEVLERFQQRQRLHRHGSLTTLEDDTWLH